MTKTCLSKILDDLEPKTTELNQDILDAVVGVSMAITDVRKALDKVDACIDKRNFEQAANLGYRDVSSAYVFLQRTLGALQSVENQKIGLVSEVAVQMECAYEDIEAQVLDRVEMCQPRKPLSEQELQEAKQKFEDLMKNLRGE